MNFYCIFVNWEAERMVTKQLKIGTKHSMNRKWRFWKCIFPKCMCIALHSTGEGARIEIYWVIIPKAVVVHNPAPSMEVELIISSPNVECQYWKVPGIMVLVFNVREKLLVSVCRDQLWLMEVSREWTWQWSRSPNWEDNASRFCCTRDLWIVKILKKSTARQYLQILQTLHAWPINC